MLDAAQQALGEGAFGDRDADAGMVEDGPDARLGISRVEGHVRGARLEDAERADDHRGAAPDAERHPISAPHAPPHERVRELVRARVELRE